MSAEIRTYRLKHVKASLIGNMLETFIDMLPLEIETITSKAMKPIKIWINSAANTIVIGIDSRDVKAPEEKIEATWRQIEQMINDNDVPLELK